MERLSAYMPTFNLVQGGNGGQLGLRVLSTQKFLLLWLQPPSQSIVLLLLLFLAPRLSLPHQNNESIWCLNEWWIPGITFYSYCGNV